MTKREQMVEAILAHYPQYNACCYDDGDSCSAGDHTPVATLDGVQVMTQEEYLNSDAGCRAPTCEQVRRLFAEHLADVLLTIA